MRHSSISSMRAVLLALSLLLLAGGLPATAQEAAPPLPGAPDQVEVNGARFYYLDQGRGEPMVLVHGTLQDYTGWMPHVEVFDDRYRVIAYSRRYNWPNENAEPPADYSARHDARDLAGLIEALELGRVHLVGLSYGALTSLILASERPDLVRSIVLAEPPLPPEPLGVPALSAIDSLPRYADLMRRGRTREAVEGFIRVVVGRERMQQIPEPAWEHTMLNAREFRALVNSSQPFPPIHPQELEGIRVPTLTILGEANVGTVHERINDALLRHIPGAESVTIPDATHLMWYDQGELTRRAVLDFLDRWAGGGRAPSDVAPPGANPGPTAPVGQDGVEGRARTLRARRNGWRTRSRGIGGCLGNGSAGWRGRR